jgi:predicted acetyltransferase
MARMSGSSIDGDEIVLVTPTLNLARDFEALAMEFHAAGESRYVDAARNLPAFIQRCQDDAIGQGLSHGRVPQSTFWMVGAGARILGCSRVRHELDAFLRQEGGHIGYDVRPSERGKGCGTRLLRLTLQKARALGLGEVLITADEANAASWRVIERNGGRREAGLFAGTRGPFRRYRVAL